jgi:hypothetical protein
MGKRVVKKVVLFTCMVSMLLVTNVLSFANTQNISIRSFDNTNRDVVLPVQKFKAGTVKKVITTSMGAELHIAKTAKTRTHTILKIDNKTRILVNGKQGNLKDIQQASYVRYAVPEIISQIFPARFYSQEIHVTNRDVVLPIEKFNVTNRDVVLPVQKFKTGIVAKVNTTSMGAELHIAKTVKARTHTILKIDNKTNILVNGKQGNLKDIQQEAYVRYAVPEIISQIFPARFYSQEIHVTNQEESYIGKRLSVVKSMLEQKYPNKTIKAYEEGSVLPAIYDPNAITVLYTLPVSIDTTNRMMNVDDVRIVTKVIFPVERELYVATGMLN